MSRNLQKTACAVSAFVLVAAWGGLVLAQQSSGSQHSVAPLTGAPSLTPLPSTGAPGPSSTLQQPTFDPYATQPNASLQAPSLLSPPPALAPGASVPGYTQPYAAGQTPPPVLPQPYPGYAQPNLGFGSGTPPVLFPGLFGRGQTAGAPAYTSPLKLFQNVSLSHAWLRGDGDNDMRINDTFITTTLAFPNFFWSGQPWFLSPGFGLHLWSGPWTGAAAWMPSNAYSAFLDVGWKSDPNRLFGLELSGRIGVFSDFRNLQNESFRPTGLALLRYNLTPTLALKAGVDYINRADIKLLPAGGFLWTPNPQTRFDIYFPQPKLASYLTTLGNWDLWWYIGGEYGGGVWTVKADSGPEQSLVDINDIRLVLGIEVGPPNAGGAGYRRAFFEVGYVWNRQIVIVTPPTTYDLGDTFMLRAGIAF